LNRFGRTEFYALGFSCAEIAFYHLSCVRPDCWGSEGAGIYAHSAPNAAFFIDDQGAGIPASVNGIYRAHGFTGRIFALQADHGDVNSFIFPANDVDSRLYGIDLILVV
jgi:hypothetical protein